MFDRDRLHEGDFSWNNALSLALASQLAYHDTREGLHHVATRTWGFDDCIMLEQGDVQGFVTWDAARVVVTFRGTESVGDWLGNLKVAFTERPYGAVHLGFSQGFQAILPQLDAALSSADPNGKKVWLTGHSLGGALATIMAAELRDSLDMTGIMTFGQPRAVGGRAAEFLAPMMQRFFRFVNDDDIVTRVPPIYRHVGRLIWFDGKGGIAPGGLEAAESDVEPPPLTEAEFRGVQMEIQRIERAVAVEAAVQEKSLRAREHAVEVSVEGIIPGVSDHAIENYIRQIHRRLDTEARIDCAIQQVIEAPRGSSSAMESLELRTSGEAADAMPVLLRVKDSKWQPPAGLRIQSRLGTVITASASREQVQALQTDVGVISVDLSRQGGIAELDQSVPFVQADQVHRPPVAERGDAAMVGIIDTGIDVLHEAFLDGAGRTRIFYFWDQRDSIGPTPNAIDPALFTQTYGTLHDQQAIQKMVDRDPTAAVPPRDPQAHGTHVASIAAGRAVAGLSDGVAPDAKLIVVAADMKTDPNDPPSIGYSNSHVDALSFMRAAAEHLALPIVVNVSLGMNAGAHDGSSTLEAAFDAFSGLGRDPGFVLVKSAGNERGHKGHAAVDVGQGATAEITWDSDGSSRQEDYIEVWFNAFDDIEFTLRDPAGHETSPPVSDAHRDWSGELGGNACALKLIRNHRDNADNCLILRIAQKTGQPIQPGTWTLRMLGVAIRGGGLVDAWVERNASRAVSFNTGDNDEKTLSIPGTAKHIITVAACQSATPIQTTDSSSWGLTRDNRAKPDLCAPGKDVVAALANRADHTATIAQTGTSMAAPHVTGSIALVLSHLNKDPAKSQVNANQVRSALIRSAKNFTGAHNRGVGFGALDTLEFFRQF